MKNTMIDADDLLSLVRNYNPENERGADPRRL
jgi:hypothetical protein